MRDLHGKQALITGAASGIGRAIALRLAQEGMQLWLLDIDLQGLESLRAEVSNLQGTCHIRQCDFCDQQQLYASIDEMLAEWQGVDLVVNNAGVLYYGSFVRMNQADWDRVLRINVHAPAEIVHRVLPSMMERSGGHILNVASMYGLFATNRCAAYHLSKFGMIGFSESLRAELGPIGVGVTALCPGFVQTKLFESANADEKTPPRWVCVSPERVAKKAIKAIRKNKRLVLVSPLAHLGYVARRIAPGLLDRLYHFGKRNKQVPKSDLQEIRQSKWAA